MNTTTKTKPLKSEDAYSCMLPTEHVKAQTQAMREAGVFTITEDKEAGTVSAYHTRTGREVYVAIAKSAQGPWIIRHHKHLFS